MEHLFVQLAQRIAVARRLLLIAHKKPDGDALGASSAFLNWLLSQNKDVTAFCVDAPPASYNHLDGIHLYTNDAAAFEKNYDVVIVFDSSDLRYCGVADLMPRLPTSSATQGSSGRLLVNFDHHATNTRYGQMNIVVPDASSTAEIAYRFFKTNDIAIDDRIATSLLTGLFFDTDNFSNTGTTQLSFEAAAELLARGARLNDVLNKLVKNKSVDGLKLWGKMLARLQYNKKYDIATTYVLQKDMLGMSSELVEGMSNFLNAVTGQASAILVLTELPDNEVKGSLRSIAEDVSRLAKLFGGGGHKKAAGFTIKGRLKETPDGPKVI